MERSSNPTALERAEKIIEAINDAGQLVCDWSICGNCGHVCLSDDYAEDTCPNCGAREDELDATVANILREAGRSVIAAALLGERIAALEEVRQQLADALDKGTDVKAAMVALQCICAATWCDIAALEAEKKELEL